MASLPEILVTVTAIFKINMEKILRYIEELIPTPKYKNDESPRFHIARSFDINKPGTEISKLKGGVIGGSVTQGTIKIGDQIEIRPGIRQKEKYIQRSGGCWRQSYHYGGRKR